MQSLTPSMIELQSTVHFQMTLLASTSSFLTNQSIRLLTYILTSFSLHCLYSHVGWFTGTSDRKRNNLV